HVPPVQSGAARGDRLVTPREPALVRIQPTRGVRFRQCCGLPSGVGGQAATRPPGIRRRFVPALVTGRADPLRRGPLVEPAALPPRTARLPVHPVLGGCVAAPFTPVAVPQFPASVPAVLDERGVLGLGDRRAGEAERLYLDRVGPLLVVVHES